jgi:hypothetical protein
MLSGPSDVLHLFGFLTGAVLYGMLLVTGARPSARPDPLTLATGVLGLIWNVGELGASATRLAGFAAISPWVHALSFTALGLLASVVVHSVARAPGRSEVQQRVLGSTVAAVAYGCAALAGVMHMQAAAAGQPPPSPTGLTTLTFGLLAVIPALFAITRQQPNNARALWMAALAVVAVSALHLGRFHGAQEAWPVEIIGHHASIVLAFAILYQDYRFALADLFLKQALTLLVLVALVFGGFSIIQPLLTPVAGRLPPTAVALILVMWASTALLLPFCRRLVDRFVDRAVLHRADYSALLSRLSDDVQQCDNIEAVLDLACAVVAPSLNAAIVAWEVCERQPPDPSRRIPVLTAEPPHYVLVVGQLAGGRRLLSDDLTMLERVSSVLARRIDALRLTGERYERMLQEREIRALATEAELRALRAQINPHFLFNTLTTLGYLIQQAPARAVKTLLDLTTLLRSVLRSEGEFTTLGRERELIECYLQIERERFEERLEFRLEIPDALAQCLVPSLIVQPLVENAVKHGVAKARHGGIVTVTARLDTDLEISVRNTGAPLTKSARPTNGIGLENVRRRLHHYYGADASLTLVAEQHGATVAKLRLPVADADDCQSVVTTREARIESDEHDAFSMRKTSRRVS